MNRILPERIDNTYRGHPVALWLLVTLVLMKGGMAPGTIFNGRSLAFR